MQDENETLPPDPPRKAATQEAPTPMQRVAAVRAAMQKPLYRAAAKKAFKVAMMPRNQLMTNLLKQRGNLIQTNEQEHSRTAQVIGPGGQAPKPEAQLPRITYADLNDRAALDGDERSTVPGDLRAFIGARRCASLTPEQRQKLLPVMARLFDAAFRKGLVEFRRAARAVLAAIRATLGPDVADQISIDDLQAGYIVSSQGKTGATPKRDVVSIETKEDLEAVDVPSSGTDLERDSGDAGGGGASVGNAFPSDGPPPGAVVAGTPVGGRRSGPENNPTVPAGGAVASGKRSDQPVPPNDLADRAPVSPTGDCDSLGSGRPGGDGMQADRNSGSTPADAARRELDAIEKAPPLKLVKPAPTVPGDIRNVDAPTGPMCALRPQSPPLPLTYSVDRERGLTVPDVNDPEFMGTYSPPPPYRVRVERPRSRHPSRPPSATHRRRVETTGPRRR
jgi:hypothetical protein